MTIEVKFTFERETKGAVRYAEVDDKGQVVEQPWAKVGTLYLRKTAFQRGEPYPRELNVTIETAGVVEPTIA